MRVGRVVRISRDKRQDHGRTKQRDDCMFFNKVKSVARDKITTEPSNEIAYFFNKAKGSTQNLKVSEFIYEMRYAVIYTYTTYPVFWYTVIPSYHTKHISNQIKWVSAGSKKPTIRLQDVLIK